MRGSVAVLFAISVIFLLSSIASCSDNPVIKASKDDFQLKTFTVAVCEERNGLRYCKDELFMNCSGKIVNTSQSGECSGFGVENQKVSGFAVLEKN